MNHLVPVSQITGMLLLVGAGAGAVVMNGRIEVVVVAVIVDVVAEEAAEEAVAVITTTTKTDVIVIVEMTFEEAAADTTTTAGLLIMNAQPMTTEALAVVDMAVLRLHPKLITTALRITVHHLQDLHHQRYVAVPVFNYVLTQYQGGEDRLEQARKVQQLLAALKQPGGGPPGPSPPVPPPMAAPPPGAGYYPPPPGPVGYPSVPPPNSYGGPPMPPPANVAGLPPNILALLQNAQRPGGAPPQPPYGGPPPSLPPPGALQAPPGGGASAAQSYQQLMAYLVRFMPLPRQYLLINWCLAIGTSKRKTLDIIPKDESG